MRVAVVSRAFKKSPVGYIGLAVFQRILILGSLIHFKILPLGAVGEVSGVELLVELRDLFIVRCFDESRHGVVVDIGIGAFAQFGAALPLYLDALFIIPAKDRIDDDVFIYSQGASLCVGQVALGKGFIARDVDQAQGAGMYIPFQFVQGSVDHLPAVFIPSTGS